jgi:hypothetical protein
MTAQVADWYRWPAAGRAQAVDSTDSTIATIDREADRIRQAVTIQEIEHQIITGYLSSCCSSCLIGAVAAVGLRMIACCIEANWEEIALEVRTRLADCMLTL